MTKPGDEIVVMVGGESYVTVIDGFGVQRFKTNALIKHLVDTRQIDLNRLAIDRHNGKFSFREWLEFNMQHGYSVTGLSELIMSAEAFHGIPPGVYAIFNPLWES